MDKREILNLTPKERDILFLWRFLFFPSALNKKQINELSGYESSEIEAFMKKFCHSYRMKLECYEMEKQIKETVGDILCGRSWAAFKKQSDGITNRFFISKVD